MKLFYDYCSSIENLIKDKKENIFYSGIFLLLGVGFFYRCYVFFTRPFHHDETLYSMYMMYEYENPDILYYRYNPILHGPWVFKIGGFFFRYLGHGPLVARLPNMMLGLFFMILPYWFYKNRWLSFFNTVILTLFISLSPNFILWSTFVQLDYWVLFFLGLSLYFFFQCKNPLWRYVGIPILISLQAIVKENIYVHILIVLGFYFFKLIFFRDSSKNDNYFPLKKKAIFLLLGCLTAIFLYVDFYSSHFRFMEGVWDGLYKKSLSYWWEQHQTERIAGPFSYHFFLLNWYELGFLGLFLFHWIRFLQRLTSRESFLYLIFLMVLSLLVYCSASLWLRPIKDFLKCKMTFDLFLCFFLIGHSIFVTSFYLKRKQVFLSFLGYLHFSFFFSYSFLAEKVPWLGLYILSTGFLFYFTELQQEKLFKWKIFPYPLTAQMTVFLLLIFYYVRLNSVIFLNGYFYTQEPLAQVHTTPEFEQWLKRLQTELEFPLDGEQKTLFVDGDALWPAHWYFRQKKYFSFMGSEEKQRNTTYVIMNSFSGSSLLKTHRITAIPLRSFWAPDFEHMTFKNYVEFMIARKSWSEPGTHYVYLGTKR